MILTSSVGVLSQALQPDVQEQSLLEEEFLVVTLEALLNIVKLTELLQVNGIFYL